MLGWPSAAAPGARLGRSLRWPRQVQLFHYHLVTSKVRLLEARYLGKLGFGLLGRYGWRGEASEWFEAGTSWEELDAMGFRLRLVELARGSVKDRKSTRLNSSHLG